MADLTALEYLIRFSYEHGGSLCAHKQFAELCVEARVEKAQDFEKIVEAIQLLQELSRWGAENSERLERVSAWLKENDHYLQKYNDLLETVADAKREARFGCEL